MKYPEIMLWLPLAAFMLDLALADPRRWPHPVVLLGRLLGAQKERTLAAGRQRLAGALALGLIMLAGGGAVALFISLPGVIGVAFALYFSYAGLALGGLLREGRKAARAIQGGSIEEARLAVSMLVSRDVTKLERDALYKTLAETMSENFTDAFVAPFFWLVFLGPVGLWVYKAVSTADSMWGYRHEPWARIGWAAARLDDLLAFVPARLSMLFLYLGMCGKRSWPGWRVVAAQARLMESPNAGWSMAAAAWLHGAPMGGPVLYAGEIKNKPHLGPEQEAEDGAEREPEGVAQQEPERWRKERLEQGAAQYPERGAGQYPERGVEEYPEHGAAGSPKSGDWNFEKIRDLEAHLLRSGILAALALWAFSLIVVFTYAYYR